MPKASRSGSFKWKNNYYLKYNSEKRKFKNKLRKLLKHLSKHPTDPSALESKSRVEKEIK